MVDRYNVHFSGTVMVMKAVSSHTVLTFCSREHQKVESVLISRTRRLDPKEVRGVNNMLSRRVDLQGQVKEMCKGAAASARGHLAVVTLLVVVQVFSSCH
jgi:hypothetical protein